MSMTPGTLNKVTQGIQFLTLGAVVLGAAFWYLPLIQQNERMREEVLRLKEEIEVEREVGQELQVAIHSLSHDPEAVERLARERLGYARPGETVIRFEELSK